MRAQINAPQSYSPKPRYDAQEVRFRCWIALEIAVESGYGSPRVFEQAGWSLETARQLRDVSKNGSTFVRVSRGEARYDTLWGFQGFQRRQLVGPRHGVSSVDGG